MTASTQRARARAPIEITPSLLRRWPLPRPDGARGKEGRGAVCVVGGCAEVPGAIILAALAALRVGAGRLQIATVRTVAPLIGVAIPEARVSGLRQRSDGELAPSGLGDALTDFADNDAFVIGPGMGPKSGASAQALVRGCRAHANSAKIVLDAGGLLALTRAKDGRGLGALIVTPHAGEMARLLGVTPREVRARALDVAREAAVQLGAVVVLKGEETYLATPARETFVNRAGNPGLATSGSGDVLAGAIAGLCARGAAPEQAAAWAIHLHAHAGEKLAGRVGPLGFLAREVLAELPSAMARLTSRPMQW